MQSMFCPVIAPSRGPKRWVKIVTAMKESTDIVVNYRRDMALSSNHDFEPHI